MLAHPATSNEEGILLAAMADALGHGQCRSSDQADRFRRCRRCRALRDGVRRYREGRRRAAGWLQYPARTAVAAPAPAQGQQARRQDLRDQPGRFRVRVQAGRQAHRGAVEAAGRPGCRRACGGSGIAVVAGRGWRRRVRSWWPRRSRRLATMRSSCSAKWPRATSPPRTCTPPRARLATATGARLNRIPQGANAVGLAALGLLPKGQGRNADSMLAEPLRTYLLFGIEPQFDFARAALATRSLSGAKVVAFAAFASEELKKVADIILPIGLLPEIEATLTNLDGTEQTSAAGGKLPGEARSGWRVLRALIETLALPGFDFTDIAGLRARVKQAGMVSGDGLAGQTTVARRAGAHHHRADLSQRCRAASCNGAQCAPADFGRARCRCIPRTPRRMAWPKGPLRRFPTAPAPPPCRWRSRRASRAGRSGSNRVMKPPRRCRSAPL